MKIKKFIYKAVNKLDKLIPSRTIVIKNPTAHDPHYFGPMRAKPSDLGLGKNKK